MEELDRRKKPYVIQEDYELAWGKKMKKKIILFELQCTSGTFQCHREKRKDNLSNNKYSYRES